MLAARILGIVGLAVPVVVGAVGTGRIHLILVVRGLAAGIEREVGLSVVVVVDEVAACGQGSLEQTAGKGAIGIVEVDEPIFIIVEPVGAGRILLTRTGNILGDDAAEGSGERQKREDVGAVLGPPGRAALEAGPKLAGFAVLPLQELPGVVVGVAAPLVGEPVVGRDAIAESLAEDAVAAVVGAGVDRLLCRPAAVPVAVPAAQGRHRHVVVVLQ